MATASRASAPPEMTSARLKLGRATKMYSGTTMAAAVKAVSLDATAST